MFESFSDSARKIIFLTRYEASRLKFENIEPQHLLLAFVVTDQGDAESELMMAMGIAGAHTVSAPRVQPKNSFLDGTTASKLQEACSGFGSLSDPLSTNADMPLSDATKKVLNAALAHANGSPVTPFHILWGMFVDPESLVARGLLENGVTREQVENAIGQ